MLRSLHNQTSISSTLRCSARTCRVPGLLRLLLVLTTSQLDLSQANGLRDERLDYCAGEVQN